MEEGHRPVPWPSSVVAFSSSLSANLSPCLSTFSDSKICLLPDRPHLEEESTLRSGMSPMRSSSGRDLSALRAPEERLEMLEVPLVRKMDEGFLIRKKGDIIRKGWEDIKASGPELQPPTVLSKKQIKAQEPRVAAVVKPAAVQPKKFAGSPLTAS
jgi:hypothetical protein